MKKSAFFLLSALLHIISVLPYRLLYGLSDFLYLITCYLWGYRKQVIATNLKNAFPDKTTGQRAQIARQYYRHLCDLIIEFIKMITAGNKTIRKRCAFENPAFWKSLNDHYSNIIIVMGHFGNWEYASAELSYHTSFKPLIIYKALSNRYFDRLVLKTRRKFGAEMIEMKNTFRAMKMHENRSSAAIFLVDQAPGSKEYYRITFLNQETAVYKGPEKLARHFNQPVVYASVRKTRRGYYKIHGELLTTEPKRNEEGAITRLHTKKLEEDIRKQPGIWLWSHRRWKNMRSPYKEQE